MAITNGPLSGIRVIDMSQAHAGPFGSMLLGDLGAEVIKLEPPTGDLIRFGDPNVTTFNYYVLSLNRNKKSIILDITSELGKKAFCDLVKKSDVVYSNFRAGVSKRQGSDYETLKKINPDIIRCNISGYGETGPYEAYPAYDIIACGHSGLLSISGDPETNKAVIPGGIAFADMMGGIFGALSVLSALISRDKDKKGAEANTNLLDSLIFMQKVMFQHFFTGGGEPGFQGNRHTILPTYGIFSTKDGNITLAPPTNDNLLIDVMGLGWMLEDPKFDNVVSRVLNKVEFTEIFEEKLLEKTTNEWLKIFRDENDIPSGPVLDYDDIANDPQVAHNEMVKEMELKGEKYKTIGSVFKFSDPIKGEAEPAPDLGQHTSEILKNILGYSDEIIKKIKIESDAAKSNMKSYEEG
jgi:crotonobetainyl-CoA:carnitine CoA-transferase CaiB-like acyl-CoA transferase